MVVATPVTGVSGPPALKVSTVSLRHGTPTFFWMRSTTCPAVSGAELCWPRSRPAPTVPAPASMSDLREGVPCIGFSLSCRPGFEIGENRLLHFARGGEQPLRRPLLEVGLHHSRLHASQVDVGRLPSHGVQEPQFVALLGQRGKLD